MKLHKSAIDQKIELLEQQAQLIRQDLGNELQTTKKKVTDIGKIALGIGGGLILSAIILRGVFGNESDGEGKRYHTRRVYHKFRDQLLGEISGQALVFILGIARDKLKPYLEQNTKQEKDDSEFAD
jgi:ABC-type transport system involved in cytochrome bd biosynthesis fused ATPase/permease subunit